MVQFDLVKIETKHLLDIKWNWKNDSHIFKEMKLQLPLC